MVEVRYQNRGIEAEKLWFHQSTILITLSNCLSISNHKIISFINNNNIQLFSFLRSALPKSNKIDKSFQDFWTIQFWASSLEILYLNSLYLGKHAGLGSEYNLVPNFLNKWLFLTNSSVLLIASTIVRVSLESLKNPE